MSAYATALLESPHNDVVEEALRQADRANAAVARIADLEAQVAKLERIAQWCRPRLSRDEYRDALDRYLKEPPTEPDTTPIVHSDAAAAPWVATHRHYKGGLYRKRGESFFTQNGALNGRTVIEYEGEDGVPYSMFADQWYEKVPAFQMAPGAPSPTGETVRRYAPLPPSAASQEPADPPWITWEGGEGVPVNAPVWARRRDETEELVEHPENRCWEHLGLPSDIVAYRLVREGGHGG